MNLKQKKDIKKEFKAKERHQKGIKSKRKTSKMNLKQKKDIKDESKAKERHQKGI